MAKVKICGIKDREGIRIMNECLPDYVGFVFAESRRRVTPEQAGSLAGGLIRGIRKTGVFVNMPVRGVLEAVDAAGLDAVQIHGDETPEYLEELRALLKPSIEIWKAFRVRDASTLQEMGRFRTERFLLDAWAEGSYGGAGKSFNWELAEAAAGKASVILAGGLTPENAQAAIRQVKPFALDVSSGVETDGGKDPEKVRAFIDAVRSL